jgi:hypothetical protein
MGAQVARSALDACKVGNTQQPTQTHTCSWLKPTQHTHTKQSNQSALCRVDELLVGHGHQKGVDSSRSHTREGWCEGALAGTHRRSRSAVCSRLLRFSSESPTRSGTSFAAPRGTHATHATTEAVSSIAAVHVPTADAAHRSRVAYAHCKAADVSRTCGTGRGRRMCRQQPPRSIVITPLSTRQASNIKCQWLRATATHTAQRVCLKMRVAMPLERF